MKNHSFSFKLCILFNAIFCCLVFIGCKPDIYEYKVKKGLCYSKNIKKNECDKEFNLYKPERDGKLPLVILLHSGAFLKKFSHKDEELINELGEELAKNGYMAASIDYHTLKIKSLDALYTVWDALRMGRLDGIARSTISKALSDVDLAVRYFKTQTEIPIDTANIFLVGYSSGGILSLNHATLDEVEFQEYFKVDKNKVLEHYITKYNTSSKVKGIVSIAGGAFDLKHINESDGATPMLLIHGTSDKIVPYKCNEPLKAFMPKKDKINLSLVSGELNLQVRDKKSGNLKNYTASTNTTLNLGVVNKWIEIACNMTTPEICGAGAVESKSKDIPNLKTVDFEGGHSFMRSENSGLNENFEKMTYDIIEFIDKHSAQ